MRKFLSAIVFVCIVSSCTVNSVSNDKRGKQHIAEVSASQQKARSKQMSLFEDGNYAMFIHFGLYSKLEGNWKGKPYWGIAEWIMSQANIPADEYMAEAADFKPSEFDAEAIVQLAKDAGMKYIVITAKHLEGFAMYDSDVDDFNIHDAGGFGRDIVGELADACHQAGLGIGLYYSQYEDWTAPGAANGPKTDRNGRPVTYDDYFRNKCVPQLKELLTKYGELELIWFDMPGDIKPEYSRKLVDLVHELQPGCLASGRVGNGMGDYECLADMELPPRNNPGPWECIDATQVGWGYNSNDAEWKSPDFIVHNLTSLIARGGTLMLNVGPTATGAIPPEAAKTLRKAGEWVHRYPDVVYGAGPSPWGHALPWGDAVTQTGKIYLIVYDWPKDGKLWVPGIGSGINGVRLYGGKSLKWSKIDIDPEISSMTCIEIPFLQPDELASVIEIDVSDINVSSMVTVDPSVSTELSVVFGEHEGCKTDWWGWMDKFGEWKYTDLLGEFTQDSWFDWTVDVPKAGYYDVELAYKGNEFVQWQVELDGKVLFINNQKATNAYDWHRLGWIEVTEPGRHCICIRTVGGDFASADVTAIRFTPVKL